MRFRTRSVALFVSAVGLPLIATLLSLGLSLQLSVLIGASTAIVMVYLSIIVLRFEDQMGPVRAFVDSHPRVFEVRESEFYDRFKTSLAGANTRVEICYFDNKSPFDSADTRKKLYYDEVEGIITQKQDVWFRRIVRALPRTENWIDRMRNRLEGRSNFSLACVLDDEPESESLPHVSVQLIDSEITYLVAVGEQRETQFPRDILIHSPEINRVWSRYYQRLWDESTVIMDRGTVDEAAVLAVKQHIAGLKAR